MVCQRQKLFIKLSYDDPPALVLVCRCCQVKHRLHCNHSLKQRLLKWRCQIYSSSCKTTLTCTNISVPYQRYISETITFYMLVQMLPSQVPSPLQSFTEAEIAQVELPDMQQQLRDNTAMVRGAYKQLSAEATGGASLEDFAWAVSVSASVAAVCAAVHDYTARWTLSVRGSMYLPVQSLQPLQLPAPSLHHRIDDSYISPSSISACEDSTLVLPDP